MATVSTAPLPRRRRPLTYGKLTRAANEWHTMDLDTPTKDQPDSGRISKVRSTTVLRSIATRNTRPDSHALRTVNARPKSKQESWDIPSSDDEQSVYERTPPPKLSGKRKIADFPHEGDVDLAPWERRKADASQTSRGSRPSRQAQRTDSAIVRSETDDSARVIDQRPARSTLDNGERAQASTTTATASNGLQARSRCKEHTTPPIPQSLKRPPSVRNDPCPDSTSRKRLRVSNRTVKSESNGDTNRQLPDTCDLPTSFAASSASAQEDLYTFAGDSSDERVSGQTKRTITKPIPRTRLKRDVPTRSTHSSLNATTSAIAPANEMVPMEVDISTTNITSPAASDSGAATPQPRLEAQPPTTPKSQMANSSRSAIMVSGTITPKQAQLWNQLLPCDDYAPPPTVRAIQRLTLGSSDPVQTSLAMLPQSISDNGRGHTRLVDRMRATMPSFDENSDESDESEDEIVVDDYEGQCHSKTEIRQIAPERGSQNVSQTTATTDQGPKRTYAGSRSYLRDSVGDELNFNIPLVDIPRPPGPARRTAKPLAPRSAFDVEDSDEEDDASGRLKTVHELRAGGVNQRFMDDTSGLLEDIANHGFSARSRRRSALLELASKLQDKAFAERFLHQGYEQALLNECAHSPDLVADLALGSAIVVLLSGDLSERVVSSLKAAAVIGWFSQFLQNPTDVRQLVKERKQNMSKSAQSSFLDFSNTFTLQQNIWGEIKPTTFSPRLLALKALDQLVTKLRRLGDRTELVDSIQLRHILPLEDRPNGIPDGPDWTATNLAISVLESLSTSVQSLAWPAEVCQRIGSIFGSFGTLTEQPQHGLFLMLRLLLNLTNDDSRNCQALSRRTTVSLLLDIIHDGFHKLHDVSGGEQRKLRLDVLVLAMGVMINLAEQDDDAREFSATGAAASTLTALVASFRQGQTHMLEAESVEESAVNVAYGYLAVALANLCSSATAREVIASGLPGRQLAILADAVHEFITYHQRVDGMMMMQQQQQQQEPPELAQLEGPEGREVWSAFTEKLRSVLGRLKSAAGLP